MNFFSRYKKLLLLIGFLALIAVIAYFIWRLFFLTPAPIGSEAGTATSTGSLPSAGIGTASGTAATSGGSLPSSGTTGTTTTGSFTPSGNSAASETASATANGGLTKTTVANQAPSSGLQATKTGVKYYDSSDGRFYKLDENGNKVALSDKTFYSVSGVTWASAANRAVISYPDGSKIMYDFDTDKQVSLPSHWEDFSFSTDGTQLVSKSLATDSENNWLVVSNADGTQAKAIEAIGNRSDKVYSSWSPNNEIIAMYTEGTDFNRQELYFLGQNGENFKSTTVEGRGFQSEWSTNGTKLLYSVYNSDDNLNPRLWIVDASGDSISNNRQKLSLQTWASKCTFASDTEVYCAVPDSLPAGSGLYPELADQTKDSLYKIDLTTGSQQLVAVPDGAYNISQLVVSGDQKDLYFTDKYSGSIYQVDLK